MKDKIIDDGEDMSSFENSFEKVDKELLMYVILILSMLCEFVCRVVYKHK